MSHDTQDWSLYSSPKSNAILQGALNVEAVSHRGLVVKASRNSCQQSNNLINNGGSSREGSKKLFREFSEWKPLGGMVFKNGHYSERFAARCNYGEVELNNLGGGDILYIYGNSLPSIISFIKEVGYWPLSRFKTLIIGNTDHSTSELCRAAGINPTDLLRIFQCSIVYAVNNDSSSPNILSLPIGFPSGGGLFLENIKLDGIRKSKVLVILKQNTQLRKTAIDICLRHTDVFEVITERVSISKYQELLAVFSHVLCLPGQGLDTYRIWESLALGCNPVCPNIMPLKEFVGEKNCFDSFATMYDDCRRMLLRWQSSTSRQLILNEEHVLQQIFRSQKIIESTQQ